MNIILFIRSSNELLEEQRRNKPIQLFLKQGLTPHNSHTRNRLQKGRSLYETFKTNRTTQFFQYNTISSNKRASPRACMSKDPKPIALPKIIKLYYSKQKQQNSLLQLGNDKATSIKKQKTKHLLSFQKTLLLANSNKLLVKIPSFSNAITQTEDYPHPVR